MERAPSDEALTETLKTLIMSRKCPMTTAQLKHDYEELEGKSIPELKLQSLMKYNSVFHLIRPVNGEAEKFDVRFDARNKMMNRQKPPQKYIQRSIKGPVIPRTRYTVTINNNNNYNQKNFNGDGPQPLGDLRQKLNRAPPLLPMPKLTMPLSERLKKRGELSPEDIKAANAVKIPDTWHNASPSDYDKLLKYCQIHKLDTPELKFLENPLTKGSYKCQVTINGKVYMAYKDDCQSKAEAQDACCKIAVQELKREEELLQNPLDVSSDAEIVKKIWQMVRSSAGGVFIKHITVLYIDTYKLSPPENWHQMVKQFEGSQFNFETNAFNEPIMFAIGDGDVEVSRPVEPVSSQQIAELVYPWDEKLWNVFVTSAFSTNDICGRLIGKNYSDALDKLLIEIEITMMTNKQRPAEIQMNHIYLTSISECYHRIRVVEKNDQQANCFCIDNGEYEWIPFEDIYECQPEFLTIAPQAFKLSLFGLEDFENDPNVAQQPLFEPLVFKSLVAEVMIDKQCWSRNKTQAIKMILYDTSTDEDVNLNQSLMNSILSSTSLPALHQKDNNQVIIGHIGDDAVYAQLVTSSTYIQQLINNVPKDDLAKHRGLYVDKADKKKVYLVYDGKSKNWFRARLERLLDGEAHQMYFIDHGYKATVKVNDIYRLDKVSIVLFFYPPQVVKFGLFNVQLTNDVKKRLLALLPTGRQALVKVVTTGAGSIPLVHLFTYIKHNEDTIMIKINDQFATSLGTELENFSPNDPLITLEKRKLKNNGEFIGVHVILVSSPQCFVIQLQDDLAGLNEMMTELQPFCNTSNKLSSLSEVKKGECYAVYDEDTRKWVRASAENVIDADFIHCYCFDSGNFKTLSLDKIRTLPNQFRKMPKLAMKAKLYGVKPKHKDFTPDDAIHFKTMTENKSFPSVIKNIASDPFDQELYEIVLFGKDEKIHETLVKDGRALPI